MNWPSTKVRETFIQYFLRNPRFPHVFIPSSSIIPRNDPSLAFVNAGMNQFKGTILGYGRPTHPRVVNSQKCLRINDLNLVGTDSYHHTFFEMLGNWSFSNYFKKEACEMAWDLLVNVYRLDPERLYITYFSGGESLPADRETKEIWEDIGVPSSRILPFGKDNFWSMAHVGPCGPSTEIHYDHRGAFNDPSQVNQDFASVVEIWNLVFMQFNRTEKGTLERLPLSHVVDTGAGLERLTAVLNGKISNYDTDLFTPIFETIQQSTEVAAYTGSFQAESQLDLAYRILADHMRAVTIALSDGVLPQTNHKIRRLIHRSLSLVETCFLPKVQSESDIVDVLTDVVEAVSITISNVYPEIDTMKEEVVEILEHEVHRFLTSRKCRVRFHESIPQLLTIDFPALARIKSSDIEAVKANGVVDGLTAFKWYDALGVTDEAVEQLCKFLNLRFDRDGLQREMERVKRVFRDEFTRKLISNEESIFVRKIESLLSLYNPHSNGGVFKLQFDLKSDPIVQIEWVFDREGDPVEELSSEGSSYWLLLNRTPFFPGSSSIVSDIGSIELENDCLVTVTDVKQLPSGWILHLITDVPEIGVRRKAEVVGYTVDSERRVGRGISYNAMYFLKEWLKLNYGVVRFSEEFVSWDHVKLEVTILSGELNHAYVYKCETHIRKQNLPVALIKMTYKHIGVYELFFATGDSAVESISLGNEISTLMTDLKQLLSTAEQNYAATRDSIRERIDRLYEYIHHDESSVPYEISLKAEKIINEAERLLEKNEVLFETARIAGELRQIAETSRLGFVVEKFSSDVEFHSLMKLSRAIGKRPGLVVVGTPDGFVQARCTIPEDMVTEELRADKWMQSFVSELGRGTYQSPRGHDPRVLVNLKRVRVPNWDERVTQGLRASRKYALDRLQLNPNSVDTLSVTTTNE